MSGDKFIAISFAGILLIMAIGSNYFSTSGSKTNSDVSSAKLKQQSDADPNDKWKLLINTDLSSLQSIYTDNAYLITPDGKMIQGEEITAHYSTQAYNISNIRVQKRITSVHDSSISYEIGNFITANKKEFSHLIIWRKDKESMKRELEIIVEQNFGTPPASLEEIANRRAEWMRLCNLHNTKNLVNSLYSDNTLYYNHRPMIVGRIEVIKEYQYMNNPNYHLHLQPLHIHLANTDTAFEIGQCSGSYGGNYVLVWKRGSDNIWRVLMDSNI